MQQPTNIRLDDVPAEAALPFRNHKYSQVAANRDLKKWTPILDDAPAIRHVFFKDFAVLRRALVNYLPRWSAAHLFGRGGSLSRKSVGHELVSRHLTNRHRDYQRCPCELRRAQCRSIKTSAVCAD